MNETVSQLLPLFILCFSAFVGGFLASRMKVPPLIGYIIGGVVAGNMFPSLSSSAVIGPVAEIGVTLLLFTVGIEISISVLHKRLYKMAIPTILQIILIGALMFPFLIILGLSYPFAVLLAFTAAFASTSVAVKVMSQKGELETIPGENASIILILQDIAVIPCMLIFTSLFPSENAVPGMDLSIVYTLFTVGMKSLGAVGIFLFLRKFIVGRLFVRIAGPENRELFAIAIVLFITVSTVIFSLFGLPSSIAALMSGLLIAEISVTHAVFTEIRPLRDLFAMVFFTAFGMTLPLSVIVTQIWFIIPLTVLIIIIRFISGLLLLRIDAFHRKTAFLTSMYTLPISEFGFILAHDAVIKEIITIEQYVIASSIILLSIIVSTPMMMYAHRWYYTVMRKLFLKMPKFFPEEAEYRGRDQLPIDNHVVICGSGRVGKYIVRALEMSGIPFVTIDYNHAVVADLTSRGLTAIYGDPADYDILDAAQVDKARAVIIAIPDMHTKERIITNALTLNRHIRIYCRSHHEDERKILKSLGVHIIVQPEFEAALSIMSKLADEFHIDPHDLTGKISRLKIEHGMG